MFESLGALFGYLTRFKAKNQVAPKKGPLEELEVPDDEEDEEDEEGIDPILRKGGRSGHYLKVRFFFQFRIFDFLFSDSP